MKLCVPQICFACLFFPMVLEIEHRVLMRMSGAHGTAYSTVSFFTKLCYAHRYIHMQRHTHAHTHMFVHTRLHSHRSMHIHRGTQLHMRTGARSQLLRPPELSASPQLSPVSQPLHSCNHDCPFLTWIAVASPQGSPSLGHSPHPHNLPDRIRRPFSAGLSCLCLPPTLGMYSGTS